VAGFISSDSACDTDEQVHVSSLTGSEWCYATRRLHGRGEVCDFFRGLLSTDRHNR
ncbi:MAG: hypothetical protein ACI8S6_003451, partial [Myxococcota bacterium]